MPPIDLTATPVTDPLEIYRLRDGLYGADLLGAAIVDFDFFTWLAGHPSDKATICRELGIVERPTDVMLTLGLSVVHWPLLCIAQRPSGAPGFCRGLAHWQSGELGEFQRRKGLGQGDGG
jgi:hypothetical protein